MKEITFEELIEGKAYIENKIFEDDEDVKVRPTKRPNQINRKIKLL